jgi:hypothetical protein
MKAPTGEHQMKENDLTNGLPVRCSYIDTFLSCFMPLMWLDLLQARIVVFALVSAPIRSYNHSCRKKSNFLTVYEVLKCCERKSLDLRCAFSFWSQPL